MSNDSWSQAVRDLQNVDDIDRAVNACQVLSDLADESRIPELYFLLQDDSFFVREAAAEPLARLEGIKSLPFLFQALTRGAQDGHDNDGLAFTVLELVESQKPEAAQVMLEMLQSNDTELRANAVWALGFVASEITAEPLLECLKDYKNPKIRSLAAGSLSSFKSNPTIVHELLKAVHDGNEEVQISVISALGYLGDPRAIVPLQEVLNTAKGKVYTFTRDALERLGGL